MWKLDGGRGDCCFLQFFVADIGSGSRLDKQRPMKSDSQPNRPVRERDVFLGALDKTPAERPAYLAAACGGDAGLRQRVEDLLAEQDAMGGFLEAPAHTPQFGPHDTAVVAPVTERPGDRIGRYKLLQMIGEGGCGVVYMAEQEEPVRRRVALKVIKLGMDTKSVIARFEAERQALAMMDHSNIARVFDGGQTATGRPYFVMELVRGIRITDYCDQNHLSNAERLELFAQVCQAIQHAHQKGIIHRDIKPSNILVTLHDGVPVPKVIDFGIAKATEQRLTEKTLFTQFHSFIGTPAYTSPEQAEMSGLDIDTRSDIYSLGVLLYELLTGRTPFDAEHLLRSGLDEMRRIIREEEPLRPSTRLSSLDIAEATSLSQSRQVRFPVLMQSVKGDLDWIVMKCLEKDRARRYATANDLAEDILRYLGNEPVLARPPSNVYRLQKLLRRHRGAFTAAAAVVLTLVTGVTVSTWLAVRATRAERDALTLQKQEAGLRHQAEQDKSAARLSEYVADINLAQQSLSAGNYGRAVQLLNKHLPRKGDPDLRGFEWRYLWTVSRGDEHVSLPVQTNTVYALAISPDGERLAIGHRERFSVWQIKTRSLVFGASKGAMSLVFHPDGRRLYTASGGTVREWDTATWREGHNMPENGGALSLSADGRRLATLRSEPRGRREATVWDTTTWKAVAKIDQAHEPIALSHDGRRLACGTGTNIFVWTLDGSQPEVVLRDTADLFPTNQLTRMLRMLRREHMLVFSRDDKQIVGARNTLSSRGVFVLSVWNADTGAESAVMPSDAEHIEHSGTITGLAFSPDGRMLASSSMDHSIRLWDPVNHLARDDIQGHLSEVLAVAYSPDGKFIASASKDGEIKIWPSVRQSREDTVIGPRHPVGFSKDGRTLLAMQRDFSVAMIVNAETLEIERRVDAEQRRPEAGELPPSEPPPGEPVSRIEPPPNRPPDRDREGRGMRFWGFRGPSSVYSPDLRWLVRSRDDGNVEWIDSENSETNLVKLANGSMGILALARDGHTLFTRGREQGIRIWDLRSSTNVLWPAGDALSMVVAPDGRTLVAFKRDGVQLWDRAGLTLRTNIAAPPSGFFDTLSPFSADGRLLALPAEDDAVALWDVVSLEHIGTFAGHKQGIRSIAFSPDGRTLATTSDDSTLKLWNVATQQELLTSRNLGATLTRLVFSPDGRLLVGGSAALGGNGGLRLYRAATFEEINRALPVRAMADTE